MKKALQKIRNWLLAIGGLVVLVPVLAVLLYVILKLVFKVVVKE